MNSRTVIIDWISALISGDEAAARRLLSGSFGIHDGMPAEAYLAHEVSEFRRRIRDFDIPERPQVEIAKEGDQSFRIFVLNRAGYLAYEDVLHLDGHRITGNGRPLEVVSKLAFTENERPIRAMAIRTHGSDLRNVTPLFYIEQATFMRSDTFDKDGFHHLSFDEGEERPVGSFRRFRALTTGGGFTFSAFMRGLDHPFFRDGRMPIIDGRTVSIDLSSGPVWSLTAHLDDGMIAVIECPQTERLEFRRQVVRATLTDAVDNDWTAIA